jgi:hypothetical protein
MKKLTTIIIAAIAIITNAARAELTTKEFEQLKSWATNNGFNYEGTATWVGRFDLARECYVFAVRNARAFGLVPVSSDTVDEAINALIASMLVSGAYVTREAKGEGTDNFWGRRDNPVLP